MEASLRILHNNNVLFPNMNSNILAIWWSMIVLLNQLNLRSLLSLRTAMRKILTKKKYYSGLH
ncbi:hypothetical protein SAMN05660653_01501 [Desulfonatronum thiosulfatophilum]|uniref:Uncharacterized protein n=1 Tax=Desulfonatronum thiosulfatophilum TaxID=617002 RepID=A0A1G6CDE5_9BACT|nr:hypothetical protein SAMN05660653_01501 [Desulfonatronum thiosulfatophilum]